MDGGVKIHRFAGHFVQTQIGIPSTHLFTYPDLGIAIINGLPLSSRARGE
jgi:hypothetical protein